LRTRTTELAWQRMAADEFRRGWKFQLLRDVIFRRLLDSIAAARKPCVKVISSNNYS